MPHTSNRNIEGLKNIYRRARETLVRSFYTTRTRRFVIEGSEISFLISDPVAQEWYGNIPDDCTSNELKFIKSITSSDDVILECGAHHGFTTIHLSKYANNGKVIAIEAFPRNAEILSKNIKNNDISNVEVLNKAISDKPGPIKISYSSNTMISELDQNTIEVQSLTIDDLQSYQPTFLKIDIEGFELEALRGASKTLSHRPKIALEIHTPILKGRGISAEQVAELVKFDNYDYYIEYGGEHPKPYHWEQITDHCHLFCIPHEKAR